MKELNELDVKDRDNKKKQYIKENIREHKTKLLIYIGRGLLERKQFLIRP